jgi:MotA/TolQ/ExbB proton channel family
MTSLSVFAHEVLAFLTTAPILLQGVATAIAFFLFLFLVLFLGPGIWLWFRLSQAVRQLRRLKVQGDNDPARVFARTKMLAHLWAEYRDTLHEQRALDPATGTLAPPVLRATMPAAVIFTTETLVDSRVRTEFFKHLPGLFTGVGIIGTFSGLIQGLEAFKVSENPSVVRNSLEVLMHGVYEAFTVSAAAIFFAMVTTFIEKLIVASLYRKAEALTLELDSMFQSGAGEEYLARLVKASEESADQSKILKDALVSDLETILSKLTDQQIQAQKAGSQALAQQFVESLTTGLQGPLQQIADSFKQRTQGNSDAVTSLLTDVLSGFSQKLEELFGGQIAGINQLQQKTIEALQTAVTKLDTMADGIEKAGARTSDAMGQKLAESIAAMESRQEVMNGTMTEFVGQIRQLVRDSQSETNQTLQDTLKRLGEAMSGQLTAIQAEGQRAIEVQKSRESELASQTREIVNLLGTQVQSTTGALRTALDSASAAQAERDERWTKQADETITRLSSLTENLMADVRTLLIDVRSAVDAVRGVTTEAVSKMNSGAETLYLAADEFTKAGQGVAGVLRDASGVSEKLVQAATTVSATSTALQTVVADYATTREALATMLADLRGTVENAKREASLTGDILSRIESATQQLGHVQKDAEDYLAGVTEVLAKAHGEFASNLQGVLATSYREFYERMSSATGLLRQAIEELALAVEPATQRRA